MAVFSVLLSLAAPALMFLLLLLVIAFLGYCLYIKYIHMKYDHIPGPPRDSFFFGQSATLVKMMENDGNVHEKFLEWAEKYGPVYRLNVLHYVAVCTYCPETTKEILMSPKYPKEKLAYEKLFNLFGQRERERGRHTAKSHGLDMNPGWLHLGHGAYMITCSATEAPQLPPRGTSWKGSNHVLGVSSCLCMFVLDTFQVAFGVDLDLLNNSSPFPKAIETCLRGMVYYVRDMFFEFKPKNRAYVNKVREAARLLRTTGAKWISERKTAIQNGDEVPKDILTQIIKSASQEESMTEEDEEFMLDNFVTFFIAGQETTANKLGFCIMELGRHPEILEKARKEVDDVIGMKRDISYDDLGELVYLSQVLKETLRIYPTAPGTARDVAEDMVIDGIHIPGGFSAVFSSYVCGRLDRFFKDPLKFDPDRFHPDAPKPYYCYYPFALGPRSCLGQNFAQMEAKVVMAKLLQRFDFTLVPGQTFDILDAGTLRPKSGVVCILSHRDYKD
uniref:Cytochrome P450, family 46, subfamily A, polypeptide 1, tandem duplicate 4 n=1 Tax=Amphilophus citrinellus TaxID=61819 RepID=A0A3Q0RET5_AMPCI